MEEIHDPNITVEQQSDIATKEKSQPKRNRPMAQATIEQNGQATNNQGGQPSKNRKIGLLPTPSGGGEVIYKGKVVQETTWAQLAPRRIFSMSADGSHPYYKISKSSYADLVTDEVTTSVPPTTQQKIYRISLAG